MFEPTDDDERTNSLGLFNTAEVCQLSARTLRALKVNSGFTDMPVRFLYYHALELYLKALLRQKHSMATVQVKFGHQIKLLVQEAETLGRIVGETDRAVPALIDDIDAMIDSRYIEPGQSGWPRLKRSTALAKAFATVSAHPAQQWRARAADRLAALSAAPAPAKG
jgi:hypothetical protein